jgi:hypothetical protein
MTSDIPICTIVTKSYLAQARILAQSYFRFHPDGRMFVCLADQIDGASEFEQEPFTIVPMSDLGIPDLHDFVFKYMPIELCTAVKPFLLEHIFSDPSVTKAIFFDPDIVLYQPLDELSELLNKYALVLTPHLVVPSSLKNLRNESLTLKYGIYNGGFIGVSRASIDNQFLEWWKNRLYDYCVAEPQNFLYVDQKWLDLVPSLFPDVFIWRDPGCNVAIWNLHERSIETRGQNYFVGNAPVKFMHFSGIKHGDFNITPFDNLAQEIFLDYRTALIENGSIQTSKYAYGFGRFENGVPIVQSIRYFYRSLQERTERWSNPFLTNPGSFFEYLNFPFGTDEHVERPYLTNLTAYIYNARKNLGLDEQFPGGMDTDSPQLLLWMTLFIKQFTGLHNIFLESLHK